ncbi:MAG: TonB-dependent receptor [Sinobacteraceae bacterium]|nr:TonB-dependent receptor [Nevskiaceae bacterium]
MNLMISKRARTGKAPVTTAVIAALYGSVGFAQEAVPELEEVTITAQKRTERLADVPVAASVVSEETLSRGNVGDISDLNNVVPSVDLVGTFNGRVPMGIRGISSNANEATVGLASGVAIMVDGVPVPSDSQSGNQLEDIHSVEVLKGPQATLGGRTASAGVINIVTRAPTDELTADASATATNDHEYRFNGFAAGPLSSIVLASVSAYANTRDFPIINELADEHSRQHNDGVRAKLLFRPVDGLDITLMGDYHVSVSHGSNFVYSYLTPGAYLLFGTAPPPLPPPVVATLSQSAVLAGVTPSTTNRYYNSPVPGSGANIEDLNFSLNVNYQLGELTLGSTTAYQHEIIANVQDLFVNSSYFSNTFRNAFAALIGPIPGSPGTWADFNNTQYQGIGVLQTSQELKLAAPTDWRLSYLLGLFFSDQRVDMLTGRTFTPARTDYNVTTDTKTYDVYGRGTFKVTDSTSLVLGLRYNSDHLSYGYKQLDSTVSSANGDTSGAGVGDLSVQQKVGPDSMAYVTYARGYAPKVFNTGVYSGGNATAPATPLSATGQEHINHLELGWKGRYWDQRVMLNAALFHTVYANYQIQTEESIPGVPAPILDLQPAGKAKTQGGELDAVIAASDTLRVDFSAAYIDARFVTYTNAPCWGNGVIQTVAAGCHSDPAVPGQLVQDVSGKTMPDSPRFKETLGVQERVPLGGELELTLGGTYSYRARAQFQPDQNPQTIQGSFGLLNLSAGLRRKDGKYSITAFCNNVTNHFYAADIEDFWSAPWNSNAVVMQPARDAVRYFGVRLTAGL